MDDRAFDALAKTLAAGRSRRSAVAGLLAALASSPGVGAIDRRERTDGFDAEACVANGRRCGKGSGKRGKPCAKCCSRFSATQPNGRRRCACKPEGTAASNASQCCSGERSAGGFCGACDPGLAACPGGCADLATDDANCGACGDACGAGQACGAGECACDDESCPDGGCCDPATAGCVAAGAACAGAGTVCAEGNCVLGYGQPCVVDGDCASGLCRVGAAGGTICACAAVADCATGRVCLTNGTCAVPCPGGGPDCTAAACASTRCVITDQGSVCSLSGNVGGCGSTGGCPTASACNGSFCEPTC